MNKLSYYMNIARAVSLRGTCPRRQVGAVLVIGDRIASTGFNGAPSGAPECDDEGCMMEGGHCVRTLHAEQNALLEMGAARLRQALYPTPYGTTYAATLYVTTSPCWACANAIVQVGLKHVVYGERYGDASHNGDRASAPLKLLESSRVIVERFTLPAEG